MKKELYLISLLTVLAGCTTNEPATVLPAVPVEQVVVHDTIWQFVTDSTTLLANQAYQKKIHDNDSIYGQSLYAYLKELVALDSALAAIQDSLVALKEEYTSISSRATNLQRQLTDITQAAQMSAKRDSIEMYSRSEWMLAQERNIFTIGTEDKSNAVEITHVYADDKKIYIAIVTREDVADVTATMNGKPAVYTYATAGFSTDAHVLVFTAQPLDKIEMNFILNNLEYKIVTTLKELLSKALKS
ncbi:hypothetical protein FACS1894199_02880 [Bacteroidia bacterium]|nr:hypothetical protein FACS1894199_02880 [Bacteroidia bacterium]